MRSRRRGSFLVIVVGTLALLSVLAILYVAIGNQDLRAKAALTRRESLDDVPTQVAEYLSEQVALDVLDRWFPTSEENTGTPSRPVGWREVIDYPSIDWSRRSDSLNVNTFFNPTGSMDPPARWVMQLAGNYAADSKLPPTDPWLASTEPTFLNFADTAITQPDFVFRRDWAVISNFAPDGRFVNLSNLRDNYEAPPGVAAGQMSFGLSLFDDAGIMMATPQTDFGVAASSPAARNTPAFWTARQRGAFRPTSLPADATPDSPLWPGYQWADADGDGMFDARWFELTDYRGGANPVMKLLDTDDSIRYFVAARAIDLSALVNVNTAVDMRAEPKSVAPAGITPADIDLRRILTLTDRHYEQIGALGYNGLTGQPDYSGYDLTRAFDAGRFGYEALRASIETRRVIASQYRGANIGTVFPDIAWTSSIANLPTDSLVRGRVYQTYAANFIRTNVVPAAASQYSFTGAFNITDLEELLTYRALNNPEITSALEVTLGGRNAAQIRHSPLRDNRPLTTELAQADPAAPTLPNPRRVLFAADIRQRLTTISGARELRTLRDADPDQLSPAELRIDIASGGVPAFGLFEGYANALAREATTARWDIAGEPESRTLFYGWRGPELAVRTAAHLAVNYKDASDNDLTSTTATVALSRDFLGGPLNTDSNRDRPEQWFPAAHPTQGGDIPQNFFNLGDTRLADSGVTTSQALNVFGVEPQPFITQVSTFTVYCDEPEDDANDGARVAIDGTIDDGNNELMYRVVAFQLFNPFDRDITLSTTPTINHATANVAVGPWGMDLENNFYYIRLNSRVFKLARLDEEAPGDQYGAGNVVRIAPLTINARSTLTVYALSDTPRKILRDRVLPFDPDNLLDPPGGTDNSNRKSFIVSAIERNLRAAGGLAPGPVAWIPAFDITTGIIEPLGDFNDPVPPMPTTGRVEAQLWKAVRLGDPAQPGEGNRDANGNYRELNYRLNDRLMDRMLVVNATRFPRKLPDGANDIENSDPDPNGPDQKGLSIVVWSQIRRPTSNVATPVGAIPAYCIEPKYRAGWIEQINDPVNPSSLDIGDFDPGSGRYDGGEAAIAELLDFLRQNTLETISSHVAPENFLNDPAYPRVGVGARLNPSIPSTADFAQHYTELVQFTGVPNTVDVPRRWADALLPLGVGPVERPTGIVFNPLERYTTFGEALAAALGYENFVAMTANDPMRIYEPLAAPYARADLRTADPSMLPFDRGHLRLDAFSTFYDANGNGAFDPADDRRGLEIPPALAILDEFSAGRASTLNFAKPGLININTASHTVARNLPLLSPPPTNDVSGATWWWWGGPNDPLNERSDIATTLIAYRDKSRAYFRRTSYIPSVALPTYTSVSFNDNDGGGNAATPDSPYGDLFGREFWGGVEGVHERPGFLSLGEVGLANFRDGTTASLGYRCNITHLGHDVNNAGVPTNSSRVGLLSSEYPTGTSSRDGLINEYKEQLMLLNALGATTSARSDYFAVWFVLHGYKPRDVNNLKPTEPIVPSVRRRFLMVLDRSNVTRRGDQPNVVLFKELPYSPQ